jgi:DNA-directed RNA polymerase specialized sigma24 family protein
VRNDLTETSTSGDVSEPEKKYLTPEEVLEKLDSLSAADKMRLWRLERRRLGGTDFKEGHLYKEAVCRAIVGQRKCPHGESFVAFLAQTMRSIASHRRAALKKQVPLERSDRSGKISELQIASDQPDPEAALIEQREAVDVVNHIYDCLEGDEQAQLVILAISEGKKGKELREAVGVDQATFDYIMKRIKKVMRKKYPKGWPS